MFDDTLISIHAPTRGATILCNHRGLVFGFQSTLPREERLSFPCNISFHLIFQSTLPREERQTMRKLTIAELNFNPRSHERSDGKLQFLYMELFISIHAPTRGATNCEKIWRFLVQFQSTLPREERHNTRTVVIVVLDISIHAPTRGATETYKSLYISDLISIHAPTRGATLAVTIGIKVFKFQSTLPREERQRFAC